MEQGIYECYARYVCGSIAGYAFFDKMDNRYLLDYFAILRGHREKGLGSAFLSLLEKELENAGLLICEIEDPESTEKEEERIRRQRRLAFYERNGFVNTGVRVTCFRVRYLILENPVSGFHSQGEIREAYADFYRTLLNPLIFEKFVIV